MISKITVQRFWVVIEIALYKYLIIIIIIIIIIIVIIVIIITSETIMYPMESRCELAG